MRRVRERDEASFQIEIDPRRLAPIWGVSGTSPSSLRHGPSGWGSALLVLTIPVTLLVWPGRARATKDQQEVRLYLDLDGAVYHYIKRPVDFRIRPWGRSEQRFRSDGLSYLKSFAGLRLDIFRWLLLQIFYAHKDLRYSGKTRKQAHLAVLDPIFKVQMGPIRLLDRSGFEYHITDRFFRYRQYLEARVMLPWKGVTWLGIFVGGELRVDSDEARVNMLDLRTGLEIHVSMHLFFKPYYYLEVKRRNATHWSKTHSLGLFLAARF